MERPSWDITWMRVAQVVALRAPCSRGRVGAVIVDSTNRIIATGYNGPPAGYDRPWEYDCDGRESGGSCVRGVCGPKSDTLKSYEDCPTIHAESNSLSFCDRREREGGSIYVTGHTCWTCAKLIANSGLRRLVVISDDEYDYRDPGMSYEFLEMSGVEVVRLEIERA